MKKPPEEFLPLAPAALHILLALAGGDLHGYGIMQQVAAHSEGKYRLGPGTLYDNLQRMTAQGLVRDGLRGAEDEDPRRRYYRLNALGRAVLAAEVARLERVLREARVHLQAAAPRRA